MATILSKRRHQRLGDQRVEQAASGRPHRKLDADDPRPELSKVIDSQIPAFAEALAS